MSKLSFSCSAVTACELASMGIPVFPCKPDKTPLTKGGFKDASADLKTVTSWWEKHPKAMIGMPTGEQSGIVVIDLDKHGPVDGIVEWNKLLAQYGAVETRIVSTQNGGLHLYFQQPKGAKLKNTVSQLAPGIDTRADGGYVITSGSYGANGAYQTVCDVPPAHMPGWLLNRWQGNRGKEQKPLPMATGVSEGCRNDSAFKLACELREKGEDLASVLGDVSEFAKKCNPPLPEREVFAVVASAFSILYKQSQKKTKELHAIDVNQWMLCAEGELNPIVTDFMELGDKLAIVAPSKCRKSFFTLQLAFCVAEGRELFEGLRPVKRRVLFIQPEIKATHFHRRVRRMGRALGFTPERGALTIINARGNIPDEAEIIRQAKLLETELIILDPIYKFFTGAENDQRDMSDFLAGFDRIIEETGAGICYIHHDGKGNPGDRGTRDRGSGSGVLGRDYDACITLTPHSENGDAVVIDFLCRNYPPRPPLVARWDEGAFKIADDLIATPETSYSVNQKRRQGPKFDLMVEQALTAISEPTHIGVYRYRLKEMLSLSENKAKGLVAYLEQHQYVKIEQQNIKGGGKLVSRITKDF